MKMYCFTLKYDGYHGEMFYLREGLHFFFTEHKWHLSSVIIEFNWLLKLPYLSEIFEKLNNWNLSMQGSVSNVFLVEKKTNAMIKKLNLWEKEIQKYNCEPFERLNIFLQDNKKNLSNFIKLKLTQMGHHLNALKIRIREYFSPLEKHYDWIRDPFDADDTDTNLTTFEKEQLRRSLV